MVFKFTMQFYNKLLKKLVQIEQSKIFVRKIKKKKEIVFRCLIVVEIAAIILDGSVRILGRAN